MRPTIKWLVIGVLVAGGLSITALAIAYWPKGSRFKYVTAPISRGRVETVVNSTGKVKPVKSVSVGAFTSGPIKYVYVDFNGTVRKGMVDGKIDLMFGKADYPNAGAAIAGLYALPMTALTSGLLFPNTTLLAEIDPRLTATKVKQDLAYLGTQIANEESVQADLKEAQREAARNDELKDIVSKTDWDKAHFRYLRMKAQLKLAQASVEQAQATLENSQANLDYTKIWSTENGIVVERKVDPGQTVAASFQTPELFVIAADMDKQMHIFGSVDEADIGLITRAYEKQHNVPKPVSFTVDAYPGELFAGKIFQIRNNSTIEQNVVTYPVVIETPNPGGKLRPNMTATITFNIEAKDDVARLPVSALRFMPTPVQVRPEDRHYLEVSPAAAAKRSVTEKVDMAKQRQNRIVWVQDGEFLRAVPVSLGLIDRQYAELVGGDLTVGQNIVTNIDATK
jgi:HlyD family secretion protein